MSDYLPGHPGFRTRCNEDFLKVELSGQVQGARKLQQPGGLAVLLKCPEQSVLTTWSSDQAVPLREPARGGSQGESTETPRGPPWGKVGKAPSSHTCLSKKFPLG